MNRASADEGLMFVDYNLRRLMNIIDKNLLTNFPANNNRKQHINAMLSEMKWAHT